MMNFLSIETYPKVLLQQMDTGGDIMVDVIHRFRSNLRADK